MNEIGVATFFTKQIYRLSLVFHTLLTNSCSKLKVEALYWYGDCGQSQQKHQNYVMLFLSLTVNHIWQINLIFLLLTLSMYLSVGHKIKSTKQLKCRLNNKAVSLKHVTCQHGLNNS